MPPLASGLAYLSRFCNLRQRPETDIVGSWLRRRRVRAPSVPPDLRVKREARIFYRASFIATRLTKSLVQVPNGVAAYVLQ